MTPEQNPMGALKIMMAKPIPKSEVIVSKA